MKEIWKDIKGYEGDYQISNLGRVKSTKLQFGYVHKEVILKPVPTVWGYYRVGLTKNKKIKQFFIHRLVAETFIPNPNPETKIYVNHIDSDKSNNASSNLKWVTAKENSNASVLVKKFKRWNAKEVKDNKGHEFRSYRQAGLFWGISPNTVKRDCLGLTQYSDTQIGTKFERNVRFSFKED